MSHGILARAALAGGALAMAVSPAMAAAPTKPAVDKKAGSLFVQCDGKPNTASTLGTIARLVAITAVIGLLLPPAETADASKRKEGEEGLKACDGALNGAEPAKDGGRRIELFYARAVHNLELKRWDAAIADLRAGEADQPALVATDAYKRSLGQTALFLEAMALTGKGELKDARARALAAAERQPYDVAFMLRALSFMALSDGWDPATSAYFDQLVRLYPLALLERARMLARTGQFEAAAADFLSFADLAGSISDFPRYPYEAHAGAALLLAGQTSKAQFLLDKAQAEATAESEKADRADSRATVGEVADLFRIHERLSRKELLIARTMFAARTQWSGGLADLAAELSRRIDAASTPEQRAQMPIRSAEEIAQENRTKRITAINDGGEGSRMRWSLFRDPVAEKEFGRFADNVWKTDKSRYLTVKPNEKFAANWLDVSRNGSGLPGMYAFYLHAALLAKARGETGFVVMPGQSVAYAHFIRLGSGKDSATPAAVLFDADKVIADLSPYIPKPVKGS